MERIEYDPGDPEIDPSIREEREAAERDRELAHKIRLEIERYVADNDLVPREEAHRRQDDPVSDAADGGRSNDGADAGGENPYAGTDDMKTESSGGRGAGKTEEKTAKKRTKTTRKAVQSLFTGSILTGEWMRRSWPYLLGFGAVLILYIAHTFQLQKWHLEQQNLEREVRELSIRAVRGTAERVRQTRRSEIVKRLEEKNIPLKEFPHPVKTIERR